MATSPEFREPALGKGSDFVRFETPQHTFSNKAESFAGEVTGILVQIYQIATVLTDEIEKFTLSRCWTDQVEPINLIFKPKDFIASVRYYNLICKGGIDSIESLGGRLSAETWLKSDANTDSPDDLRTLLAKTKEVHEVAQNAEDSLIVIMGLSGAQITDLNDINDPGCCAVPAASPGEIRFWVTWNTKDKLRILSEKIDSGKIMEFYAVLQASLKKETAKRSPFPLLKTFPGKSWEKDTKKNRLFSPVTYFFCLGTDRAGTRFHKMIHVGATQERLQLWPALWRIRQKSRLGRVFEDAEKEDAKKWDSFFSGLMHVEKHILTKTELGLTEFRTQLMEWRLGLRKNPPDGTDGEDYDQHIPVLRSCGGHLGQSFQPEDDGRLLPVACCLACKLTIGYEECETHEISQSAKFNLHGRAKAPWSCAEVISSRYCEEAGMIEPSPPPESTEATNNLPT